MTDESTPDEVPTHEPISIRTSIPGDSFDAHDDPIGLILAMADEGLREMVTNHGGDAGAARIETMRGVVNTEVDEDAGHEVAVVVLEVVTLRPFGWVKPTDHVGEPGSEVS